jgi:hypothetical protein
MRALREKREPGLLNRVINIENRFACGGSRAQDDARAVYPFDKNDAPYAGRIPFCS